MFKCDNSLETCNFTCFHFALPIAVKVFKIRLIMFHNTKFPIDEFIVYAVVTLFNIVIV